MIHDCTTPSYCNSEADVFLILARVKRGDMGKDFVLIGHKEAPAGADFLGQFSAIKNGFFLAQSDRLRCRVF